MRFSLPRKLVMLLVLLVSTSTIINAQNFVYGENQNDKGFKIKSSNKGAMVLQHNIYNFQLSDTEIEGESMKQLKYGLSILPSQAGAPDVPGIGRYILIPNGAKVKLNVISETKESYKNIDLAPAAEIPFDTEDAIPAVKGIEYQKDAFFPAKVYQSETTTIRGMNLAMININPFQYNPVTKELIVYKNVELEVEIIGGNGLYGEDRFRSKFWDPILEDLVLNYQDIPAVDYTQQSNTDKDIDGCEYLIIVPDNADFLPWADSIKLFRTEQGIHTEIITTPEFGGNSLSSIKDFVDNIYETWDPVPAGILLMADYGNDDNTITSKTYPHPYSGNYITDNYFADYTGNDMPDFVFARMTGRNSAEFETMVKKFIDYERTPPMSSDFYNKPITALGWQTERWFQICSETVGGYMLNVLGKAPVRINAVYGGNPNSDPWSTATNTSQVTNYFGPGGLGYIPATPAELGNWSGGSAGDVVTALNDGAFILQHRDHGSESGWGEPAFGMSHISQLNNVGELSHIFSINCLTGRFDVSGECFAEKFHRYTNGGALSLTAASQVSYSFVNDAYVWGMYDNMWPDFMPDYGNDQTEEREFRPAFGNASGKFFLSYTNWPYNTSSKQITYRLFHHHGDVFNIVYTEVPEEMDIVYSDVIISGPEFIEVQAEEGAMIAFSVDGALIGVGEGTGTAAQIPCLAQEPGTAIKVVITKQNYFRHEGFIQVIAPDGPYIVKSGLAVDDNAGNNNGFVDFGEDILLDFSIKNLGSEIAENITVNITSADSYINITDANETFGNVGIEEEVTHEGAFSFTTADDIPDNHSIAFDFIATNGTDVWESSFSIKGYAPILGILNMNIVETNGNGNGRIDAGEDAAVFIEIENSGHCDSPAGISSLISSSDYLTINTDEFTFTTIDSSGTIIAEFNISTDINTPIGSVVSLTNDIEAGMFTDTKEFYFSVGLIVEDWETGDFSSFEWTNSGTAWTIDNTEQYEGDNSAKSGNINDSQSSELVLSYNAMVDDQISFFYKVSSESGYDKLKFYIDGSEQGSWSGEVAWTEASFPVSAGSHIFKWAYSKDVNTTSGSDCAWVDYIILPPMLLPSANAGNDAEICDTDTQYQTMATASDYENIIWSTSGDGTFSATDEVNPIYTVGSNDISNGSVDLTITATGGNGSATNTMTLSLVGNPMTPATPEGETNVCYASADVVYTINDENNNFQWYLSPDNAATITEIGNNAYISFNDGFSGEVSLTAMAYNACGESSISDALLIQVAEQASVSFVADAETCAGTETALTINLTGNAPWTVEIMDDAGAEINFEADASPFDIMVSPSITTNYTLMQVSDANDCIGDAAGTAVVTVFELPTATLSGDAAEVCGGDVVEVNLDLLGAAPWNISLGDGADELQDFVIDNASELVEFIAPLHSMDLQIVSLSDNNECIGSGDGTVAITVIATPDVNLGVDTAICHNVIYELDAGNEGSEYSWSTGEETQTIEVDQSMANDDNDAIISVEVTNTTGCKNTDEIIIHFNDCTGINELDASKIQLMPNPNNGRFIVDLSSIQAEVLNIDIYNSLGEMVTSIPNEEVNNQTNIDISHLADGVYFLKIITSDSHTNKRFVIRK